MTWLARLYARRIVNVNINVIAAGLLALGPLTLTVHIATEWLGLESRVGIAVLSFVADACFDVAIYFCLHWVANHSAVLLRAKGAAAAQPRFFRDATLVQFERAILSPLLYGVAISLQQALMHHGWTPAHATAVGFAAGILTSRVLHTLWMIRTGRVY